VLGDGPALREAVAALVGPERFDFVWLDGDHEYPDVKADLEAYRPLLAPGGLLAGHDFDPSFPGVPRAVREFCPGYALGPGSIWYVRC
jgi:predicted O-methyltransferase YrrM